MNDWLPDLRRLRLLAELARLGSMRAVAEELKVTTSTVSQQIAALAAEAGTPLVEPVGRRVRLTPAGLRLAGHAVTILAAAEAARLDLDPTAEPRGTLRVAGFATAIRRSVLPVAAHLATEHPLVRLQIREHEPAEALDLLATDGIDLALVYDYDLAPADFGRSVTTTPLWSAPWALGVPSADRGVADYAHFRDHDWIVNSRNTADDQVVRTLASLAGFEPTITHRADSLALVADLIAAGYGVGLLPADQPVREGVALLPLDDPGVSLRSYAVTRLGRAAWPPLALTMRLLTDASS